MAARWSSVVKCVNTVRLTWNGATSTNVDVYRNGVVIATTPNDGLYVDSTGDTGQQHLAQNRRQFFIRTHHETVSVAAVRVCNPDCSPTRIPCVTRKLRSEKC
jgi:hypothetical protein